VLSIYSFDEKERTKQNNNNIKQTTAAPSFLIHPYNDVEQLPLPVAVFIATAAAATAVVVEEVVVTAPKWILNLIV
jgi:hypothetical protein